MGCCANEVKKKEQEGNGGALSSIPPFSPPVHLYLPRWYFLLSTRPSFLPASFSLSFPVWGEGVQSDSCFDGFLGANVGSKEGLKDEKERGKEQKSKVEEVKGKEQELNKFKKKTSGSE